MINYYINTCIGIIALVLFNIGVLNHVMSIEFSGIWINKNDKLFIQKNNDSRCKYIVNLNRNSYSWCFSKNMLYGALYYIPKYNELIPPPDWQIVNVNGTLYFGGIDMYYYDSY